MCLLKVFVAVLMFECGTAQFLPNVTHYRSVLRETREISPQCSTQLDAYLSGLLNNASWAWNIFDATPKIPYGILTGNLLDAGNYDECLRANTIDVGGQILGKFCRNALAVVFPIYMTVDGEEATTTKEWKDLVANTTLSRSSFPMEPETGIRILVLSVCVPNACTAAETLEFFYISSLGLPIIPLDDVVCETVNDLNEFTGADLGFVIFISIIAGLVLICTIYDELIRDKTRPVNPLFVSFSFTGNFKKILKHTDNKNRITCLDGLRVFSIFWVVLGHRYSISEILPFVNKDYSLIWMENLYTQYVQGAPIAVDTFMFITGLLMAMSFIRTQSSRDSKLNLILYYVHRYLRLTPALAVLYFLHVSVFLHFGSGPYWTYVTHRTRENCLNRWASVFFYYQNYLDYNDMCLLHTWYLSMDMQIFVISPILLLPLAKHRKVMMRAGMPILILFSIAIPFLITYFYETQILTETYYIYYYYPTHTRLSAWLIGVYSGAIMHALRNVKLTIHPIFNLSIWAVVLAGMVVTILCGNYLTYNYDRLATSIYIALHRPAWCVGLAWIVFACTKGRGGIFDNVLSSDLMQTLSKVTYSMYLVHVTWLLLSVGTTRYPGHFGDKETIHLVAGDVIMTIALAFIWSVLFESPMISIEKFIFGGIGKPKAKTNSKTIDIQDRKVEESSEQSQYQQTRQINGDQIESLENGPTCSFKFEDDTFKTSTRKIGIDDIEIDDKSTSQTDDDTNSFDTENKYTIDPVDPVSRSINTYELQNELNDEIKYEDIDKDELPTNDVSDIENGSNEISESTAENSQTSLEARIRQAETPTLEDLSNYMDEPAPEDPSYIKLGSNEISESTTENNHTPLEVEIKNVESPTFENAFDYKDELGIKDASNVEIENNEMSESTTEDNHPLEAEIRDARSPIFKDVFNYNDELATKHASYIEIGSNEVSESTTENNHTPLEVEIKNAESPTFENAFDHEDELGIKDASNVEIESKEMSESTTEDNHPLEAEIRDAGSPTVEDISNSIDEGNRNRNLL